MHKAVKLLLPLLALAVSEVSGANAGELSLRQRLLEETAVETLYSVDEHTTLFTASGSKEALAALGELCRSKEASLASVDNVLKCGDAFSAEVAGRDGSYLIKSGAAEPIAYRTPSVPPYEEIETPPDGEMEGALAGIDMYQYMYALCKKGNGKAFTVISKRAGRFVRLVEASPEEAFRHLFSSGDSKDPWFFACEGETKFIVEKDYGYSPDDRGKFTFRQNRGLEWVDFMKAGDKEDLARLDSGSGRHELFAGK